ncbi:glycosyltransferase [Candidatus Poribacteria bacterium]
MRIAINAINLVSAGTLATGKQFLSALADVDRGNHYLVVAPSGFGYEDIMSNGNFQFKFYPRMKWLNKPWRIYQDFVGFKKLIRRFGANAALILGNICPVRLDVPTVVLFRNSYYVDQSDFQQFSRKWQILKKLEMLFFRSTTKRTDAFVVQSEYMKERLSQRWSVSDSRIKVIPNAISTRLNREISREKPEAITNLDGKFKMLYVSRYYPHKNHEFIVKLAKHFRANGINDLVFLVTLNKELNGVEPILREIRENSLEDLICNIEEMPQEELADWYRYADILFFPSHLETFGNAFVESMSFGLPICAVDLPYARSVCDNAAVYYQKDSLEDAAQKILMLKNNAALREEVSNRSEERFHRFPSWQGVAERYLNILENSVDR